jgi:hypothetical protein
MGRCCFFVAEAGLVHRNTTKPSLHGPNEKGVSNLTVYSSDEGEDEGVDDLSLIDLHLQPGALESRYSRLRE